MGRPKKNFIPTQSSEVDSLITDGLFIAEVSVSPTQKDRYDADPRMAALGWPPKVKIAPPGEEPSPQAHNFRSRRQTEIFKKNIFDLALKNRDALFKRLYGKDFKLPEIVTERVNGEAAE